MKRRSEFIAELLVNKKLTISDRERLLKLAALQFDRDSNEFDKIWKEINRINSKKSQEIKPISIQDNALPEYVDPRNTANFLLEFNQNTILKSTTHNIDSNLLASINELLNTNEYEFVMHLAKIKIEYAKLKKKFTIIKGLAGKIDGYLLGHDSWSQDNILMSWSSPELRQWCIMNPNTCPNPEIDDLKHRPFTFESIKLKNRTLIQNFCELVLYFKKQTTIRIDNNLKSICQKINFQFRDKVEFDIESMPSNIDFFTDVEKLNQAYKKIIEMCISVSPIGIKPKIKLGLIERIKNNETEIVFSILHSNSKFGKSLNSLDRYGSDFTGLIKFQLNGLCNWELVADFNQNDFASILLWPKTNNSINRLDFFSGVQFNLIFYR